MRVEGACRQAGPAPPFPTRSYFFLRRSRANPPSTTSDNTVGSGTGVSVTSDSAEKSEEKSLTFVPTVHVRSKIVLSRVSE